MIVEIDDQYLVEDENIIDHIRLVVRLLECYHYIKCDAALFDKLEAMMARYGGKRGCELFRASREGLSIPRRIKDTITTVVLSQLLDKEINVLLFKPSELLVENSANEWPVYERIINAFKKDPTYGGVVEYINRRKGCFYLVPANAGGKQAIPAIVELKNNGEYQKMYKKKVCVIFDRDTDDSQHYSPSNNRLFELFAGAGKNSNNLTEQDVYKLNFGSGYIWHMWYKRAIENYFPAEKYEAQGMDIRELPTERDEYDYYHFKEPKTQVPNCYKKTMVKELGKDLNYQYYQQTTKSFDVDGGRYNEMLLLMLKIAKIV